jgi:hypothetical protein
MRLQSLPDQVGAQNKMALHLPGGPLRVAFFNKLVDWLMQIRKKLYGLGGNINGKVCPLRSAGHIPHPLKQRVARGADDSFVEFYIGAYVQAGIAGQNGALHFCDFCLNDALAAFKLFFNDLIPDKPANLIAEFFLLYNATHNISTQI